MTKVLFMSYGWNRFVWYVIIHSYLNIYIKGVNMKYIKAITMMLLLIVFVSCTTTDEVTYEILINESTPTTYEVGASITYTDFFIIKDSLGNRITIEESMLDVSLVDMSKAGSYIIKISFEGVKNEVTITVTAPEEEITYTLAINESLPTTLELNDSDIDFKAYFTITDSKGNLVEVLESMIDSSKVNLDEVGTYNLVLNYQGLSKTVVLEVVDNTPVITYTVVVNDALPTEFTLGTTNIDFKTYFTIVDSNGTTIEVTDDMLDLSTIDFTKVGTFSITFNFNDIEHILEFEVTPPDFMYANDLFISEYSEGSSYNKYIEIFNGTGKHINLSEYSVKLFNNGASTPQYELALSGVLNDGETYIIYNGAANTTIKNSGDLSHQVISFNGNDPIALYKNDVLIDVVGIMNTPVPDGYNAGGIVNATKDNTIVRKSDVFGPNATWNEDEWLVLGFEDYTNLKLHEMDYYHLPEEIARIPDLYISEYFEGDGIYATSKYIEIYNGLGYDVDLSNYRVELYSSGSSTPTYTQNLSGTLKHKEVYVIYAPLSLDDIKLLGHLSSEVANFTGRDALTLVKDNVIIDVFGVIGETPNENGWLIDGTKGSVNYTVVRIPEVTGPLSTWDLNDWKVTYQNDLSDLGKHNFTYEDQVIEDFDILFNLIKGLELNSKGTATSAYSITIKGTVFMDVQNETTLVYITDGKNFIKLHGEKIHNYTSLNTVYEVKGNYKSHLYIPTFEVINPGTDITAISSATPVSTITVKEVSLSTILNLKLENFVENINNGYLQSMLKVTGYLQLDTHNSTRWDYALTVAETYTKNNTQYINNGLYFKNDIGELEDTLIDYEVDLDYENVEVSVFGVIYDWNPNRKNWRLYVSNTLTSDFLLA